MENKARKRKTETILTDINKKNRHITIYDDIYREISGIKYDIYLVKESISEIIKKNSGNKNSGNKILDLEKIIKENEIKRDEEMSEIKNEIQEIKEMILSMHFQKVNISEGNIDKDNDMSYIN